MARLCQMMLEELQRRNYDDGTIRHYIRWVEQYADFFGKSPNKLGPKVACVCCAVTFCGGKCGSAGIP